MSYRIDILTPTGWRRLASGVTHPTDVLDVVQGTVGSLSPERYSSLWHALDLNTVETRLLSCEFSHVQITKEGS